MLSPCVSCSIILVLRVHISWAFRDNHRSGSMVPELLLSRPFLPFPATQRPGMETFYHPRTASKPVLSCGNASQKSAASVGASRLARPSPPCPSAVTRYCPDTTNPASFAYQSIQFQFSGDKMTPGWSCQDSTVPRLNVRALLNTMSLGPFGYRVRRPVQCLGGEISRTTVPTRLIAATDF